MPLLPAAFALWSKPDANDAAIRRTGLTVPESRRARIPPSTP